MSYIIDRYKQRFGEVLKPLGFKQLKKSFYREINDVLQILTLLKTPISCTIEFDIVSLAWGVYELSRFEGGYDISRLREGIRRGDWEFVPTTVHHHTDNGVRKSGVFDERSMDAIIEDMYSIVATYVIPAFECGTNAKTAYEEMIRIDRMIPCGSQSDTKPDYGFSLLCIQSKDYTKAYQHLTGIVERWDKAYPNMVIKHEKRAINEPDWLFERFLLEYKELKELYYKLSIQDIEYLQEFVSEKEAKSRKYLKNPH